MEIRGIKQAGRDGSSNVFCTLNGRHAQELSNLGSLWRRSDGSMRFRGAGGNRYLGYILDLIDRAAQDFHRRIIAVDLAANSRPGGSFLPHGLWLRARTNKSPLIHRKYLLRTQPWVLKALFVPPNPAIQVNFRQSWACSPFCESSVSIVIISAVSPRPSKNPPPHGENRTGNPTCIP